jgi:hypothetical protein
MVRVFWGFVVVLVGVTAGVFLLPGGTGDPTEHAATSPVSATNRAGLPEAGDADDPRADAFAGVPAERPGGDPSAAPAVRPSGGASREINPPSDMPNPDEIVLQIPRSSNTGGGDGPGSPVESVTVPAAEQEDVEQAQVGAVSPADAVQPAPVTTDATPNIQPLAEAAVPETNAEADPLPSETEPAGPESEAAPQSTPESDLPSTQPAVTEPAASDPTGSNTTPPVDIAPKAETPPAPPAKAPATEPVVKTPTGLLLDGRWNVEGKGTPDSPYEIEWDMLIALQRDYSPRLGKTEIPAWMNALNGKTVTIRGYALLPMGVSSLSELLVMLNQWDSCCIGVPPTPYDAIEVRLAKPLSNTAQSMFSHTGALSFGDLTGTFKIDPYIVQGYLLGLYLLEDASANLLGPAGTP